MTARLRSLFLVLIYILVLLRCFQPARTSAVSKPLTVCEALHNFAKYSGKIIEVRGEFNGGLMGDCVPLTTGDITWITAITLDFPGNTNEKFGDQKANWKFDLKTYEDIAEHVAAMQRDNPGKKVLITVKGRLDTLRKSPAVPEGVAQPPEFVGYGHLGVFPARLVLMSIKDLGYETSVSKP